MKSIVQQIEETKRELMRTKPRSRRHVQLEIRLRDLLVRQLRAEMRQKAA